MDTNHKEIIKKFVSDIQEFSKGDIVLVKMGKVLEGKNTSTERLCRFLYVLSSIYLIDEITTQPTSRENFIDMSSYYYRSESYSMDFIVWLHEKYNIPMPHLERERSLFFSNRNFIKNFLGKKPTGSIGGIYYLYESNPDFKIPCSRQAFLVELFKASPDLFYEYFKQKFNPKLINSRLVNYRNNLGYSKFLLNRALCLESLDFEKRLEDIVSTHERFTLVSSGTASNFLVSKYLDQENCRSYYHKYWYYENISGQETPYFFEIKDKVFEFKNFYFNIESSNYFDVDRPEYFEDIRKCIIELLDLLRENSNDFNIVIDSTSDPFFQLKDVPPNVHIFKTISLSKYQEGLNTNFLGLVVASKQYDAKLHELADYYGLSMTGIDKEFCFVPEMSKYKERNSIITKLNKKLTLEYRGWKLVQVGLSYILLPNKSIMEKHIVKFALQKKLSDRMLTWEIRNKVNELIANQKIKSIFYGDSFLFPDSRVVIQGPKIDLKKYVEKPIQKVFKYRLPRISLGYDIYNKEINSYLKFSKSLIDLIMNTYDEL